MQTYVATKFENEMRGLGLTKDIERDKFREIALNHVVNRLQYAL